MSNRSLRSNFLVQGSILALAGILVRVIGMLYRIPVVNIIGSDGNGIYSAAYNVYNIVLVLSSYGLPMAVSKLISARLAEGEYRNSAQIFRSALILSVITGGCACALLYFGAGWIERTLYPGLPGMAIPLRVLAPTVLIVAVLGVFRGFYQGHGQMEPTAVSQLIEQIVNAVVSVAAGYLLMRAYTGQEYQAAHGAAGSTLGTCLGALSALIFFLGLTLCFLSSLSCSLLLGCLFLSSFFCSLLLSGLQHGARCVAELLHRVVDVLPHHRVLNHHAVRLEDGGLLGHIILAHLFDAGAQVLSHGHDSGLGLLFLRLFILGLVVHEVAVQVLPCQHDFAHRNAGDNTLAANFFCHFLFPHTVYCQPIRPPRAGLSMCMKRDRARIHGAVPLAAALLRTLYRITPRRTWRPRGPAEP